MHWAAQAARAAESACSQHPQEPHSLDCSRGLWVAAASEKLAASGVQRHWYTELGMTCAGAAAK